MLRKRIMIKNRVAIAVPYEFRDFLTYAQWRTGIKTDAGVIRHIVTRSGLYVDWQNEKLKRDYVHPPDELLLGDDDDDKYDDE